ncbi:FAD-binding and (Fe-S)-binding domain-containing protein [Membranihabitans maritimus]|uniref:FAD-binding and (Fe-S)-binding domain-containing protein n=1 Tax=Membranihabitans maritimus TaxID=2904244 RepID=UPI001F3356D5|nr:FAD-binding and (Fe-S)-binding domain-containing protein [Membranihabitans maritimus]
MQINTLNPDKLRHEIEGELFMDDLHQTIYSTDASIYKEKPVGVVFPKSREDLQRIVVFAKENNLSLIPRAAGTSLAGQCVGNGLVVDISRYMTNIIEVNVEEQWVKVQPGVIRDELNNFLKPYGLFFGPNTSTANRCMIGGMVGNNSCGSTSIEFGNTRDHVLEIETVLSDGSIVIFKEIDNQEYERKIKDDSLEGRIYKWFDSKLKNEKVAKLIAECYPHPEIKRRNQGYALDRLLEMKPYSTSNQENINLSKFLCGSEGTLAITASVKLNLVPLPSPQVAVLCIHFQSINESMKATVEAMRNSPSKCELMDKTVLDCAKTNPDQLKNMFFVQGDPQAILMVEFRGEDLKEAKMRADKLKEVLQSNNMGFAFPIILGEETNKIWELRAAGLGVLSNVKGDAKPIACIEDTAVRIKDLPEYIAEFEEICSGFNQKAVFYAHAGAGELHLRPILNLKTQEGVKGLRDISFASAKLVKKYRGVLSGEHGDGRVRAEFLPFMVGEEVYGLWKDIKRTWDPNNLFNPGKIVDAPPMDTSLRYTTVEPDWDQETVFDYSDSGGMMKAIEKCNGTGDCRKIAESGGTMCPSYMATRKEKDTTRARANAMREYMKGNGKEKSFESREVMEILDLCLSCKGCSSECPSNVDMTKLKAEYQYHYYKSNRRKLRDYLILHFYSLYKVAAILPGFSNLIINTFSSLIKSISGFAPGRSLPQVSKVSWGKYMHNYMRRHGDTVESVKKVTVYMFIDEFIDLNEASIGIKTVELLKKLGYKVVFIPHKESGRAAFSKGFLEKARSYAEKNVEIFSSKLDENNVLVGIEPSAILGFRSEYPNILRGDSRQKAIDMKPFVFTIEEFLWDQYQKGKFDIDVFDSKTRNIKLHLHCHYKSISDKSIPIQVLSIPRGNHVEYIPSGCCGMAGSFGFEKEHFDISNDIAELVLFPSIRDSKEEYIIAAQGVSCRHQILDGINAHAVHPIEILYDALV